MSLLLHKASKEDLKAVTFIQNSRFAQKWKEEEFQKILTIRGFLLLVAEEEKKDLGFILIFRSGTEAEIYLLGVLKEEEGKGIGRMLLSGGEKEVKKEGAEEMLLDVRKGNRRALDLYTRNGYVQYHVRKGYYENGEDALLLRKAL